MDELGLEHGKSGNGVEQCCYSCINGEPEGDDNEIRCDKGQIMKPNEFCPSFSINNARTSEEVIIFVQDYIAKNSGI